MVAGDAGVALKDFRAEVSAVLLALPSWMQDGNVSGSLICSDHCLWARGSQKRTEFKRKLGGESFMILKREVEGVIMSPP